MSEKTQVRKTYKYRMYRNDKADKHLFDQINIAGIIWNHCLALQKRYYRLTKQYISQYDLQEHIAKLATDVTQLRPKIRRGASRALLGRWHQNSIFVVLKQTPSKSPPQAGETCKCRGISSLS